jgi:transketolase
VSDQPEKSGHVRPDLAEKCINTIKFLAVDAVQKANSGHPGMPMEASALACVLWSRLMRYNPANPQWPNRDRFILSAGHGSMLLYAMLHLTGYDLSLEDLKNFRQWESRTPGHPEYGRTPGVETTTGPLGQGFATGVGMAMAESFMANLFNQPGFPLVDYFIYGLVSDGDMMEGISSETASLAGHLGLGKMIYIYLDNRITIEGSTDLTFSEDVAKRFEAYNWHVQRVDGYDLPGIEDAVKRAQEDLSRPSLIIARTCIACGSPNKENSCEAHGAPLGAEEVGLTKQNCGWPDKPGFLVPDDVLSFFRQAVGRGKENEGQWSALFKKYKAKHPDLAAQWDAMHDGPKAFAWDAALPKFEANEKPIATRAASGRVLAALAPHLPGLIGGSADLAPSNNTFLKGFGEFKKDKGPNIHFGIREHAMGAILNGLALSKALIPYGGTFLVFSDYMRPAIRLAALMKLPVIYVFTHDSIGLGEDGPTHQPIEQIAGMRAVPNLTLIRPADANETTEAWRAALLNREGPTALVLTRQTLPILDRTRYGAAAGVQKGAYILADAPNGNPDLILIGSGSEVHLLLAAQDQLKARGIGARAVSVPSWELFQKQSAEYKETVLPSRTRARLAVEAGCSFGWERFVGLDGDVVAIDRFGESAPDKVLFKEFGFTVDNVVKKAEALLQKTR